MINFLFQFSTKNVQSYRDRKHFSTPTITRIFLSKLIIIEVNCNGQLRILVSAFCYIHFQDNLIGRYQAEILDIKLTDQLRQATKMCNEVSAALETVASFGDEPFDMNANALESVAKGRHVLTRVSDYLHMFFIKEDSSISGNHDVMLEFKSLLKAVKRLCPEGTSPSTPHMFLVRQLVICYGFDRVRNLGRHQELQWIVSREGHQVVRLYKWLCTFKLHPLVPLTTLFNKSCKFRSDEGLTLETSAF